MSTEATTQGTEGNQNDAAAAAAAAAAAGQSAGPAGQAGAGKTTEGADKGSSAQQVADPFAELETDNREWLTKSDIKDVKGLAKRAHEQAKLLGNAIRLPGKDATPEEVAAFHEKLGVPKTAEEYGFAAPKELPADLPYDGERAKRFAVKAKELGIPKGPANALHDWFIGETVGDVNASTKASQEATIELAQAETAKLEKLYGPVTGDAFKANAAYADQALQAFGGQELVDELKSKGLIGEVPGSKQTYVKSAKIFEAFAKVGRSYFKEGDVLKGNLTKLNNPFEDGSNFNLTAAMKLYKENPDQARALIEAAGKKPSDFGLKA